MSRQSIMKKIISIAEQRDSIKLTKTEIELTAVDDLKKGIATLKSEISHIKGQVSDIEQFIIKAKKEGDKSDKVADKIFNMQNDIAKKVHELGLPPLKEATTIQKLLRELDNETQVLKGIKV